MVSPTKYITKPVVVEAMQVSLDNLTDIAKWCGGYVRGESIRFTKPKPLRKPNADNSHYAIVGDYVIKTNYGFTVMKPAKFELRHTLPKE